MCWCYRDSRRKSYYLAKGLRLGMLLKAEGREVDPVSENSGFGQDADTSDAVDFHLHIGVTVGVSEVCQMRPPGGILGIAFDNHGVFVQSVR